MIEDIMKLIEMFYIAYMFVYNQMHLLNFDVIDNESSDYEDETLSDLSDISSISSQEDIAIVEYTGSQQNYHTRILKTMKIVCNYDLNMSVLLCYLLTNETEQEKQVLLSQLLTGVDEAIIEEERIIVLKDDIDVRIYISAAEKDKTKKNSHVREIKVSVESVVYTEEDINAYIHEIKKLYVKVNGVVKPKFINEMYIHYFNESCFLEQSQVMKIKKTVSQVIDSYNTSSRDPDRFLTSLLT
jgi:hypothetical protein